MRRRKKSYALRHFHIWTQLQNKNHTPFFPGPHTTTRQLAYLRLSIFSSPANCHISSHIHSQAFSFVNGLVEALYGPYPRAEDRRTAVAQSDVKALSSVQDGEYWQLIEFLDVDSSLNAIILNNCSVYFKLTWCNVEWTESHAQLM